jgi:PAS domain S-box-containing protein
MPMHGSKRGTDISARMLIFPIVVFVVVASIFVMLRIRTGAHRQAMEMLQARMAAEQVSIRLSEYMDSRISAAEVLAAHCAHEHIPDMEAYRHHVSSVYDTFTGFQAINWIDESGTIQWVYPLETNAPALGVDLRAHPVAGPVIAKAAQTRSIAATPPLDLLQGGRGIAMYIPVEGAGGVAGYLNVVFCFEPMIADCFERGGPDQFIYTILEGDEEIFRSAPKSEQRDDVTTWPSDSVPVADRTWTLRVAPLVTATSAMPLHLYDLTLVCGIGLALGLSIVSFRLVRSRQMQVQRSRELQAIYTAYPDAQYRVDGNGRIIGFHIGAGSDGLAMRNMHPRSMAEVFPPEVVGRITNVFRASPNTATVQQFEYAMRCGDDERTVEARVIPVGANHWLIITRDTTDRTLAERSVRESKQMLQLVLDTIPVRVFWKDTASRFIGCNQLFARDAGLASADDIIGRDDFDMPWKEQADLYRSDDAQVMRSGRAKQNYEEQQTHADGSVIWLRTSKIPLRDDDHVVFGVLGTYEDITERKEAEERQRRLTMELDHRVKNNLANVLALAERTLDSSQSMQEFAETFIGRIRSLARTHEALAAGRWTGVQLDEIMRLTILSYDRPGANNIRLEGPAIRLPARAAGPLTMTVHELVTNAVKYGALSVPTGQLSIEWDHHDENGVMITWTETNGPMIQETPAPGLGSQLIHGLVEHELNGRVHVAYRPSGVVCRIEIPLDQPDQHSTR